MGRTPGDLGKRPARTFTRKIPLRVRRAGLFDGIGEPLPRTVRAASVCGLVGTPSGSTYEANRFRFGNGSEMPNHCHGGHGRR